MKKVILAGVSLLFLMALACSFNFSSANISEATLARDADGNDPTTVFNQDDTFYVVVQLANAPDDTSVKAVWTAVEADGVDPNFTLDEAEVTSGGGELFFELSNVKKWSAGTYKVDLLLNEELDRSLEFEVEGEVAAAEVEEEPTATPSPSPTPEPEPTATETLEAQSSMGDSLGGGDTSEESGDTLAGQPADEPADEPQALPMESDPYIHPSGAFTFAVPQGWEPNSENEFVASFGDQNSLVGVEFFNPGRIYDEELMQTFIGLYLDNFILSGEYEILAQEDQPDGSIYVAVVSESQQGDRIDTDLFFEQRDTIMFILYFSTFIYDEMKPTWDEIIASYGVDAAAAKLVAPDPTPTPRPAPTATPKPAGPAVPAGKGILLFNNSTGIDFVLDVIGPTNTSEVIPPGTSKEFVLDPGRYTLNGHSPGGQYAINAYEFDLGAGQVFPLNLQ